jgi:hypothetical protein
MSEIGLYTVFLHVPTLCIWTAWFSCYRFFYFEDEGAGVSEVIPVYEFTWCHIPYGHNHLDPFLVLGFIGFLKNCFYENVVCVCVCVCVRACGFFFFFPIYIDPST